MNQNMTERQKKEIELNKIFASLHVRIIPRKVVFLLIFRIFSLFLRLNCFNPRREVVLHYLEEIVLLVDINKVNARTPEAIRS